MLEVVAPQSVELGQEVTIEVRAVDDEGSPIGDLVVSLLEDGGLVREGRTGADGRLEIVWTPAEALFLHSTTRAMEVRAHGGGLYEDCLRRLEVTVARPLWHMALPLAIAVLAVIALLLYRRRRIRGLVIPSVKFEQ